MSYSDWWIFTKLGEIIETGKGTNPLHFSVFPHMNQYGYLPHPFPRSGSKCQKATSWIRAVARRFLWSYFSRERIVSHISQVLLFSLLTSLLCYVYSGMQYSHENYLVARTLPRPQPWGSYRPHDPLHFKWTPFCEMCGDALWPEGEREERSFPLSSTFCSL